MVLATLLELCSAELFLGVVLRQANKEADALADGRFDGFDPALRVPVVRIRTSWLVLDRWLPAGAAFQRET